MGGIRIVALGGRGGFGAWLVLAASVAFVPVARGQTPPTGQSPPTQTPLAATSAPPSPTVPDAATVDLYKQARQLLAEGKWAEACPKFEAIVGAQQTAAVLINIGDCHEHDGKLATAYADFERARILNAGTLPLERREAFQKEIQRRVDSLLPRIPTLEIRVDASPPGLTVRRDGQPVLPGAFRTPLRLDPGSHEVTAEAPGLAPRKYVITLKPEGKQVLNVALSPPLEPSASRYAGAIAAGSVAVVLGGVTAGLGAWTVSSHHDIVTKCAEGEQACKDEAAALQARGTATNVVLGLAGAAAVTAGVLFLVERSKAPKAGVALTGTGAMVRVRW